MVADKAVRLIVLEKRVSFLANIHFDPHADIVLPCNGMDLDVSGNDWRHDLVLNCRISIFVAVKFLDRPEGQANDVIPKLVILAVGHVVFRHVMR